MTQCDAGVSPARGMVRQCGNPAAWRVGPLYYCAVHKPDRPAVFLGKPKPEYDWNRTKAREGRRRRKAAARERHLAAGLTAKGGVRMRDLPFMAVDGEGIGKPGKQRFALLRVGSRELYRRGRTLHTQECLELILNAPRNVNLIWFAGDYDATHILAELTDDQRRRMFLSDAEKVSETGGAYHYVYWKRYAIDYIPRQYLAVARLRAKPCQDGGFIFNIVPKSRRVIWETYNNFRSPFVGALEQYGIGEEHWKFIARMKSRRGAFMRMSNVVRRYNALECELLAALMDRYREACRASGALPAKQWNGPAKISRALMRSHDTMRSDATASDKDETPRLEDHVPAPVLALAQAAYIGGRAEVSTIGRIVGPLWAYDRRSAYGAALAGLPCLEHGRWERRTGERLTGLYVAQASFTHPPGTRWGTLPWRETGSGRLSWPMAGGQAAYWSDELDAARRLGATVTVTGGFRYIKTCYCCPFGWVPALYEARHGGVDGLPVKAILSQIYGQFVRRKGGPGAYQNYLWGSLVTARTRAALLEVIARASSPDAVVLLATDALVSREQLPGLELGDGLGQWKQTQLEDLFIAQPGLYWTKRAAKTRGFSPKVFLSHVPEIEASWDGWIARGGTNSPAWWRRLPKYKIAVEAFISLRAGTRQGKQPGRWEWPEKTLDFLWHNKRRLGDAVTEGMAVATWPLPGRRGAGSAVYDWDEETVSEQNELDMLTEGNPDALDWSPPGFTSN